MLLFVSPLTGQLAQQVEQLPPVVALVNQEPLARGSLLHWIQKDRHAVARYFHRHHAAQPGPDFWHPATRYGGENPFDRLLRQSLEKGIVAMVLQQLAVANGIADSGLEGIDQKRQAHNAQRRQIHASGGVIYGPKHFAQWAFHDHYLSLVKIELEALFAQGELKLPSWARTASGGAAPATLDALLHDLRRQTHVSHPFSFDL